MSAATLVVGQSGGPTAVINSTLAGILVEAARQPAVGRVLGLCHGVEGLLAERWLDLTAADATLIRRLRRTPSAALGTTRYRLRDEDLARALDVLRRHAVRYLLLIGGNDSADTTERLGRAAAAAGYPLQAVAVPKTIDNDLPATDHCPGYGSIARYVAVSVQEAALETAAMRRTDPVRIIEVMGRHAGWVAAAATLGRPHPQAAPHLVYLPERPVVLDAMLAEIEAVYRRHGYAVIVLSENQTEMTATGVRVLGASGEPEWIDPFGHPYYPSPAAYLCRQLRAALGLRARYDRPGSLQRTSRALVSPVDEREAFLVGRAAVRAAVRGQGGHMVTLVRLPGERYRCVTGLAPLAAVANQQRLLPPEFIAPTAAEATTPAFAAYARPLLGGPLPDYVRLAEQ
ncbi:MAG TPA: diphosphate--fructose-6-phosphate 1-phosphotransferase [Chloroflexota bacterium]|nr:diphosphate--fructose-6-phosphate 1-phosphotransferase [Chloroflexota bacterium]HZU06028.1 diphosphate--fructose-6-phosphate 1-phosphotransferase [Chloroflexota bacterium]